MGLGELNVNPGLMRDSGKGLDDATNGVVSSHRDLEQRLAGQGPVFTDADFIGGLIKGCYEAICKVAGVSLKSNVGGMRNRAAGVTAMAAIYRQHEQGNEAPVNNVRPQSV